jgi:prepilin-type N-terminal cleavage/methylation domain-containing protein
MTHTTRVPDPVRIRPNRALGGHRRKRGFTLLELIVVLVILGILALIAIPTFQSVINGSGSKAALNSVQTADDAAIKTTPVTQTDTYDCQAVRENIGIPSQTLNFCGGTPGVMAVPYLTDSGGIFSNSDMSATPPDLTPGQWAYYICGPAVCGGNSQTITSVLVYYSGGSDHSVAVRRDPQDHTSGTWVALPNVEWSGQCPGAVNVLNAAHHSDGNPCS